MKNLFLPYELAIIAKEKGYKGSGDIKYFYNEIKPKEFVIDAFYDEDSLSYIIAPLYQQIVDWLEETYDFFFERLMNKDKGVYYIVWNGTSAYSELKTIDKAIEEAFNLI